MTGIDNSKSKCRDVQEYLFDKGSWSLLIEKFSLDYDDKLEKLIFEANNLQCLQSDGFCKPTLKLSDIFVLFPWEICFLFHIFDFIGRMSELNNRYWFETDDFFNTTGWNTDKVIEGILTNVLFIPFHHWKLLLQLYQDRKLFHTKILCTLVLQ